MIALVADFAHVGRRAIYQLLVYAYWHMLAPWM